MYCQTCGTEIQPGLNYCNRCGAPVNSPASPVREVAVPVDISGPVRWVSATVLLTMFVGFGILFIALSEFASRGLRGDAIAAMAFMGLFTVLLTELSLIRLLSRLVGASKERGLLTQIKKSKNKELHHATPQFIQPPAAAYNGPIPSVTEHTTRTFSAPYREPRTGN